MIPLYRSPRLVNQRNFVLAVAGLALAAIIGYFAYEARFLREPRLELRHPARDLIIEADAIELSGRTDPEAELTVNGRPLYIGETGEFEERLLLVTGLNRLEFEAKNRYGKTTRITRYIVVR